VSTTNAEPLSSPQKALHRLSINKQWNSQEITEDILVNTMNAEPLFSPQKTLHRLGINHSSMELAGDYGGHPREHHERRANLQCLCCSEGQCKAQHQRHVCRYICCSCNAKFACIHTAVTACGMCGYNCLRYSISAFACLYF